MSDDRAEDAKEFEAAGIYEPNAANAEDRLATLRYLVELGATTEQLVCAAAEHRLVALAGDLAISPGPRLTMEEAAVKTGMPIEQIAMLNRLVGLAPLDPREAILSQSDLDSFQTVDLGTQMFGEQATLHFGRVLGNAMSRIAEAAQSTFLVRVEGPLYDRHASELELARAQVEGVELIGVIPQLMDTLLRAHVAQGIRRKIADVDAVHQGISTVAVGFVDLVGFTPLSHALGPQELLQLISDFEARTIDVVAAHGGRVVKLIGDEVMFTAENAASGCAIALDMFDAFRDHTAVEARGGMHVGPTLAWGGDRYGPTVNCASRISELAVPFEMLVTEEVRASTLADSGFTFEPAGRRMLRGFPEPVALYSLTR